LSAGETPEFAQGLIEKGNASMPITKEMNRCIEACLSCYRTCLGTAMNFCLETGASTSSLLTFA